MEKVRLDLLAGYCVCMDSLPFLCRWETGFGLLSVFGLPRIRITPSTAEGSGTCLPSGSGCSQRSSIWSSWTSSRDSSRSPWVPPDASAGTKSVASQEVICPFGFSQSGLPFVGEGSVVKPHSEVELTKCSIYCIRLG